MIKSISYQLSPTTGHADPAFDASLVAANHIPAHRIFIRNGTTVDIRIAPPDIGSPTSGLLLPMGEYFEAGVGESSQFDSYPQRLFVYNTSSTVTAYFDVLIITE